MYSQLMSLLVQINYCYDDLTKRVVNVACLNKSFCTDKFPMKTACLHVGDMKHTTDVVKGLWRQIRCQAARELYQSKGIIGEPTFDSFIWDAVKCLIECKSRVYQLWHIKQCLCYCVTGKVLHHWEDEANSSYPSCGQEMESARQINCYTDTDQK